MREHAALLRQWVDDFGVKTEDIKNLTISALIAKLMASDGARDGTKTSTLLAALATAKEYGLAEAPAASVVGKAAGGRG